MDHPDRDTKFNVPLEHRKSAQAQDIPPDASPFYGLLKAIDPSNMEVWERKFETFKPDRFNWSWNWPSFFFGFYRYFLKGISIRVLVYVLAAVIYFFTVNFLVAGLEMGRAVEVVARLLVNVFFGIRGSHDYYRFCLKHKDDLFRARRAKKIGMINFVLLCIIPIVAVLIASFGQMGEGGK